MRAAGKAKPVVLAAVPPKVVVVNASGSILDLGRTQPAPAGVRTEAAWTSGGARVKHRWDMSIKRHNSGDAQPFAALRAAWEYEPPSPYAKTDRIFRLADVNQDARFRGLTLATAERAVHEILARPGTTPTEMAVIRRLWKRPRVVDNCSPWNNCPFAEGAPAFSQRAVDVLGDLLESHGTLLPLGSHGHGYHLFVARVLRDGLDARNSHIKLRYKLYGRLFSHIDRYGFHLHRLNGAPVFRIPQQPFYTFVTDAFVQRVKAQKLTGFHFEVVFPLRTSEDPEQLAWRAFQRHLRDELPAGQSVCGREINATFLLDNPDRAPTVRQQKQIRAWAGRLERQLFNPSSTDPPVGYHDVTTIDTGEVIARFVGPDAKELIRRIEPLISDAGWPGQTRLGPYRRRL